MPKGLKPLPWTQLDLYHQQTLMRDAYVHVGACCGVCSTTRWTISHSGEDLSCFVGNFCVREPQNTPEKVPRFGMKEVPRPRDARGPMASSIRQVAWLLKDHQYINREFAFNLRAVRSFQRSALLVRHVICHRYVLQVFFLSNIVISLLRKSIRFWWRAIFPLYNSIIHYNTKY